LFCCRAFRHTASAQLEICRTHLLVQRTMQRSDRKHQYLTLNCVPVSSKLSAADSNLNRLRQAFVQVACILRWRQRFAKDAEVFKLVECYVQPQAHVWCRLLSRAVCWQRPGACSGYVKHGGGGGRQPVCANWCICSKWVRPLSS